MTKKITDYCYKTKRGEFKCKFDKQPCMPGESSCGFTSCLTKLAWGLRTPGFREQALKELEDYLEIS